LWDAETSEEFILGSLAALKGLTSLILPIAILIAMFLGHERLVNQGILHRDLSPGNTYLGEPGCREGWEGFIADLELASIAMVTEVEAIERPPAAGQLNMRFDFQEKTVLSSSKAPGAEITVCLLFSLSRCHHSIIVFRALLCLWPESSYSRCCLVLRTRCPKFVLQK